MELAARVIRRSLVSEGAKLVLELEMSPPLDPALVSRMFLEGTSAAHESPEGLIRVAGVDVRADRIRIMLEPLPRGSTRLDFLRASSKRALPPAALAYIAAEVGAIRERIARRAPGQTHKYLNERTILVDPTGELTVIGSHREAITALLVPPGSEGAWSDPGPVSPDRATLAAWVEEAGAVDVDPYIVFGAPLVVPKKPAGASGRFGIVVAFSVIFALGIFLGRIFFLDPPGIPETAATDLVEVVVDSEPVGATVMLDQKTLGRTPLRVREKLAAGESTLTVSAEGYRPSSSSVSPSSASTGRLELMVTLERN